MMNRCHPSPEERNQIRHLVDVVGAVEVLRVLGQIIAHDHPDLHEGVRFRGELMGLARELDRQPEPVKEERNWIALDLPSKAELDSERGTAENIIGATLVDVLIITDEGCEGAKKLEPGFMKVIGDRYCDWNDAPLVRVNPGPVVNAIQHDTWKSTDNQLILIPTKTEQAK